MRKLYFLIFIALGMQLKAQQKPKIVVGIVVDQMRQEYLYRFYHKFSNDGFKRLMDQGYVFKNAHYNYVPTYTAPGHASIYTGTTPANHGIISNKWYNKQSGLEMYCVTDIEHKAVAGSKKNGKISPKNLTASTITDELRTSSNFRSKVIGVSIKDRSAVLPAGHNPNGAFWFDDKTGTFMSSTYYFETLPEWVSTFNRQKKVNQYLKNTWNTLLPIESYVESTADNVPYERTFKGKTTPTFPYDLSKLVKDNGIGIIRTTPYGNTLLLDLGLAAIEGEGLGNDEITDFLAISFSSTDHVGHAFGPQSIELEDTYLRLDLEIKRLLDHLDDKFEGEYQVFLTADHGVANIPQFQIDNKLTGGYFSPSEIEKVFGKMLEEHLGEGDWIANISNNQIFLNNELIMQKGMDPKETQSVVAALAEELDHVEQAYPASEIKKRNGWDLNRKLLENGYHNIRSGDVLIRLKSGYLSDSSGRKGTTHGSGGTYDTHIPIVFFGKNISSGTSVRRVEIVDIAPTLSMLLDITLPDNATGLPLKEIFE